MYSSLYCIFFIGATNFFPMKFQKNNFAIHDCVFSLKIMSNIIFVKYVKCSNLFTCIAEDLVRLLMCQDRTLFNPILLG